MRRMNKMEIKGIHEQRRHVGYNRSEEIFPIMLQSKPAIQN